MIENSKQARWKNVGLWVLSGLIAAMFLFAGGTKLLGQEMHVQNFQAWGYPAWFMYAVGLLEVLGAVILLMPRVASYGALILTVNMLGAAVTHIGAGEFGAVVMPVVLLGLLVLIAWGRWSRLIVPTFLRLGSPA